MKRSGPSLLVGHADRERPCGPASAGPRAGTSPCPRADRPVIEDAARRRDRPRASASARSGPPSQKTRVIPRVPRSCSASARSTRPRCVRRDPHDLDALRDERPLGLDRRLDRRRRSRSGPRRAPVDEPARQRRAQAGIEDDPDRRAVFEPRQAHGQQRIVGEHRADADHDRIRMGAHQVDCARWRSRP